MKTPQRKPNKVMTPTELINKAFYGNHKPKTEKERQDEKWMELTKKK